MPKAMPLFLALLLLGCTEREAKTSEPKLACDSACDVGNVKAWYQKKYGEPISEFELSATKVDFRLLEGYEYPPPGKKRFKTEDRVTVTKAATNALAAWAIATNEDSADFFLKGRLDAELDMAAWLEFMRDLHALVSEWEKEYEHPFYSPGYTSERWFLDIYFSGKDEPDEFRGVWGYPWNWDDFKSLMHSIKEKIAEKDSLRKRIFDDKLNIAYYERFGEPITIEELSSKEVKFYSKTKIPPGYKTIMVTRGIMDAKAKFSLSEHGKAHKNGRQLETELAMEEWLDFVRVLRKSDVYKWEWNRGANKELYNLSYNKSRNAEPDYMWLLSIKDIKVYPFRNFYAGTEPIVFSWGKDDYPPNWAEFKKAMDDMEAKVKEKAGK
jgi:hypothetical protein